MPINCPNRNRKKRLGRGGGKPLCKGELEVTLHVPLSFGCKGLPHGPEPLTLDRLLLKEVLRYGFRVRKADLERAFYDGKWDATCPLCGWSLRALMRPRKPRSAKR